MLRRVSLYEVIYAAAAAKSIYHNRNMPESAIMLIQKLYCCLKTTKVNFFKCNMMTKPNKENVNKKINFSMIEKKKLSEKNYGIHALFKSVIGYVLLINSDCSFLCSCL